MALYSVLLIIAYNSVKCSVGAFRMRLVLGNGRKTPFSHSLVVNHFGANMSIYHLCAT